ncbi:MAG: SDR family oxidoreductase [Planctomycetota bacterium]|nr:SDR family oxidoreductase [Planctomycetota bacterium]
MAKNVVVTGGAGFIGSHLVRALLERGHKVSILDNFLTGYRSNVSEIESDIEIHEVDLRDQDGVSKAIQGNDWVFHLGALGSVPRSIAEPRMSHDINLNGSQNVLLAARDAGADADVMASSSSVYGETIKSPKHEDFMPGPLSPYAFQKLSMEQMGQVYSRCYGLRAVSLRYFNVFGPRQDPKSSYAAVIPKFVSQFLKKEPPVIYGDGEQTRDFTYIDNVVSANLLAAEKGEGGLVTNIAGGHATSVNDLAKKIKALLNVPEIKTVHEDARSGDVKHSLADVERARASIGFETIVPFDEGLRRTVAWYQESHHG